MFGGSVDGTSGGKKQQKNLIVQYPVKPPEPPNAPKLGHFMQEKKERVDTAFGTLQFCEEKEWGKWGTPIYSNRFEWDKKTEFKPLQLRTKYETKVIISSEDSITAVMRILSGLGQKRKRRDVPLVLSMAHAYCKGGGFLLGARAQEEDICRRTDMFMHLQNKQYPLPEFGAAYSFPVSILRDNKFTDYKWLPESKRNPPAYWQFGIISAPAYEKPVIDGNWRLKMKQKVKCLLQACFQTGHRILIFSAWGCGAFGNPPEEVAGFFKAALEGPFAGCFDQVIFSLASNKLEGNVGAFMNAFKLPLFEPGKV